MTMPLILPSMRKVASILLGSGFSVPEGLPTVQQLNHRMSKIGEEEIFIHSSMVAAFLNGQEDRNRWLRRDERYFVQDFLEFYNTQILKPGVTFHYEDFYDFYSLYLGDNQENAEAIESFCKKFADRRLSGKDVDSYNRVSYFNRTFNQLLASQLYKPQYLEDVTILGYPGYSGFLGYLQELLKTHDVNVHSVNHDIFFDWLGRNETNLFQHFSDGFEYEGSPFYGTLYEQKKIGDQILHKGYKVKLAQFTGRYDTPLCFYKLHGSISNIIINTGDGERIRVRAEYGVERLCMERKDESTGRHKFVGVMDQVDPDFLSGTTNKMNYYENDPFYKTLFAHFKDNLIVSETLLVIGYGFRDAGINKYLEDYYLSEGREMFVIDPGQPNPEFLRKHKPIHIRRSVTDLTYDAFTKLLPEQKE